MAERPPHRVEEALIDSEEKMTSHLAHLARSFDQATSSLENLRLALPTGDIRGVRQTATDAIDKAMR